ncbi:hypothetical protein Tco_0428711 [Tanacetum coccineum]
MSRKRGVSVLKRKRGDDEDQDPPADTEKEKKTWFNDMVNAEKNPLTFDDLMATPIDFTKFAMNHLKKDKITKADLVGPVYKLLKGTCRSSIELEYNMEQCYLALSDQLDWANPEGNTERKYSASITKTKAAKYELEGIEDMILRLWSPVKVAYDRNVELGIYHWGPKLVRRADQKEYTFKEGDCLRLHLNDIEDMLLLHVQNKLFNLPFNDIVDLVIALRMFTRSLVIKKRVEDVQLGVESYHKKLNITKPQTTFDGISYKEQYTTTYDPEGVVYLNKRKRKRLMRADELYKFCDGKLKFVRKILNERLQNFVLGYNKDMPKRKWTNKDQIRTHTMVKKIDNLLLERQIMRSLEGLVGERNIETDKRLLLRTNIRVILHSIHSDDGNPSNANIKQALRLKRASGHRKAEHELTT